MIPNEGNTSSYLLVLICDLTRTILTEFESIVSRRMMSRIELLLHEPKTPL